MARINDKALSAKRQRPPSSPMIMLSLWLVAALLLLLPAVAPRVAAAGSTGATTTARIVDAAYSTSLSLLRSHSSASWFTPSCSFGGSSSALSGNSNNNMFRSFWASPSSLMTSSLPSKKKRSTSLVLAAAASSINSSNNEAAAQLGRKSYSFLVRQKQRLVHTLQKQQPQLHLYKPIALEQQQQQLQAASSKPQRRRQGHAEQAADVSARGGGGSTTASAAMALVFWENMICGAASRSVAQTVMHPANCLKTLLQTSRSTATRITAASLLQHPAASLQRLTQGAGASLLLSLPTGAVNFAVLEYVRQGLGDLVASTPYLSSQLNNGGSSQKQKLGPVLDFASSALSTIVCSLVATPQTMVCDNIMAGNYNNLPQAITGLARRGGIRAFYQGWMPGLAGKIPAYALTWTLFQRFKDIRQQWACHHNQQYRPATNFENSIMACLASAASVSIMIPMDCIKTRLVTQGAGDATVYKGILDCAIRIAREEGIPTFYRGLPPRLVSVVPMMAIQFAVYEAMKRSMLQRKSQQLQEQHLQQQHLHK